MYLVDLSTFKRRIIIVVVVIRFNDIRFLNAAACRCFYDSFIENDVPVAQHFDHLY